MPCFPGSPRRRQGESWRLRLRGELLEGRRPLSVASRHLLHLAVPGKHIGLTLILVFSDRCGKSTIASSAPGSAMALFPLRGERQVRKAAILRARGRLRAAVSPSHRRTPSVTATSRRDSSPGGGARGSPYGLSCPHARYLILPAEAYSLFLIPYSLFLIHYSLFTIPSPLSGSAS